MTKTAGIVKLIVLIVVLFLVIAVSVLAVLSIRGYSFFNINNSFKMQTVCDKSFKTSEIKGINVDAGSADVIVQYGNTDKVIAEFQSNNTKNTADIFKSNDGTLTVTKNSILGFNIFLFNKMKIVITVPKGFLCSPEISTKSGNIEFKTDANDANLTLKSGNAIFSGNSTGNVKIETASGNIDLSGNCDNVLLDVKSGCVFVSGSVKRANLSAVSGNIKCESSAEKISADTTSGNIELNADGDTTEIKAKAVSGNIKLLFDNVAGYSFDGEVSSGTINDSIKGKRYHDDTDYIVGDGKLDVNASVKSGNIKIESK